MTAPRSRAAIGVVTLVLAAGLLIAAPRLMPEQVVGTAESDWPAPPAVGACLTMPERGELSVVPCDRPHDAEVTRSWAATDPALNASPSVWMDSSCTDAASGYIGRADFDFDDDAGPGESRWQPVGLAYKSFQLLAPESERAGSRGWRACIIRPTVPVRYTGIVRDAAPRDLDQSTVPEAYRTCLDDRGNAQNCTLPHPVEVLALGTEILDLQVGKPVVLRPGWESADSDDGVTADPGSTDPGDTADPGATGPDGATDPDDETDRAAAEARAQAELARGSALLFDSGAFRDAEASLAAQCLDLAPGLVPALAPAPSTPRARVGLSGSTAAFGQPEPGSGIAVVETDDTSGEPSSILAMGEVNGSMALTAACVVTAPDGQQFTHSLLGWQGDDLPLIPH